MYSFEVPLGFASVMNLKSSKCKLTFPAQPNSHLYFHAKGVIIIRKILRLACLASVSSRVRPESWDESKKKRNDGGGGGE